MMIKREAEKETPEDLKQAFRVFDKVTNDIQGMIHLSSSQDGNGFVSTSEIKYVLSRFFACKNVVQNNVLQDWSQFHR